MAYSISVLAPEWHEEALCRGRDQTEFFGHEEQPGKKRHRPTLNMAEVRAAKAICAACPVQPQCYESAMRNREEFGIWSGTTGRDRRKLWRLIDAGEITEYDARQYVLHGVALPHVGYVAGSDSAEVLEQGSEV